MFDYLILLYFNTFDDITSNFTSLMFNSIHLSFRVTPFITKMIL